MSIVEIVAVILGIGGVASTILVIWNLSNRVKKERVKNIKEIVNAVFDSYSKDTDHKIEKAVRESSRELLQEIKKIEGNIERFFSTQTKFNKASREATSLLKESVIESYKRSIRDVYYKLSKTGEITDVDKAYIDKIFPKYKTLGGNSDIEAKYKEISKVFTDVALEKFRDRREKIDKEEAKQKIKESRK